MLMLAFGISTSATYAQSLNSSVNVTSSTTVNAEQRERPQREPNPEMQKARADIQADREALNALREEQQEARTNRRAATQEMGGELRANVQAGEMEREEAQVEMAAQRESNRAAAVEEREERAAARTEIVSKRQAMIDARIAAVRERSPEMAEIMENYYSQIMDKIAGVQALQTELIASVSAGEMTGAEAKAEFKAFIEVEKAAIKSLMEELKAEVSAFREAQTASRES